MCAGDLEPPIINPPLESNHSSVPCLCVSTRAGIKFSLTYPISRGGPTDLIIYRHLELLFMLIAESVVYIFQTDSTAKNSSLQNSSFSFPYKNSSDSNIYIFIFTRSFYISLSLYHSYILQTMHAFALLSSIN